MEHIELINKIIEAEQRAQKLSEETLQKREEMQQDLINATDKLREKYFARAQARLDKIREREASLVADQTAQLDKSFDRDIEAIETAFAAHRDEWVDKLFNMIVAQ